MANPLSDLGAVRCQRTGSGNALRPLTLPLSILAMAATVLQGRRQPVVHDQHGPARDMAGAESRPPPPRPPLGRPPPRWAPSTPASPSAPPRAPSSAAPRPPPRHTPTPP